MPVERNTGRDPTAKELAEAKRIAALPTEVQRQHPSALSADQSKLDHINTYGWFPEFYIDKPFRCRDCGKEEIWKAADQKRTTRRRKLIWMRQRSEVTIVANSGRQRSRRGAGVSNHALSKRRHRGASARAPVPIGASRGAIAEPGALEGVRAP
jgi:hypothetical protein